MFRVSCSILLAAAGLHAQTPQLTATPAQSVGQSVDFTILGGPSQPYAVLFDVVGGPLPFMGQTLYLGSSAAGLAGVQVIGTGFTSPRGVANVQRMIPPGVPVGVPFYSQGLLLDLSNNALQATDGESLTIFGSAAVMVEDFDAPLSQGYTGEFNRRIRGRLQAEPARVRTHTVNPAGGIPFSFGIRNPLNPRGARVQAVYRAEDLGASGQSEAVTALRWLPVNTVAFDSFARMSIDLAHSDVVPDYTIGSFSGLPVAPNSGLNRPFQSNVQPGSAPVRIYDGAYAVDPAQQQADGYVPYPAPQQSFVYNGQDSLLLDVRMAPSAATGFNGQQVYLMVPSSPRPDARVFSEGSSTAPFDPFVGGAAATTAQNGDNALYALQVEFTRTESLAVSPWRRAPRANPDYQQPSVAASVPPGAGVRVEYRGADDSFGSNATAWSASIDVADGRSFLQYRVFLDANLATGAVPSVDAIVTPVE